MEKAAYYRFAGRDLGLRFMLDRSISVMDKTAAGGQQIDEDFENQVGEYVGSVTYVEELNKRAHNYGVLKGYAQVLESIEAGTPIEKIAQDLQDALNQKVASASFPAPETDEELASLQDEMVKGAAEAIGSFADIDPTSEEVLSTAIDLVAAHLEAE